MLNLQPADRPAATHRGNGRFPMVGSLALWLVVAGALFWIS